MAEEKTYVFGEGAGNNGILSLLGPMLSQRGVDPNVLLAMQGRNNDGFGEGGWFIWVIFLFFLMGWGGNGFGNNGAGGLGNQLNNDYGREMLLQAINGNGNAISQLATTLNCDTEHLFGGLRLARNCILCSRYLLYRWNSRRIRTNRM